VKENKVTAEHLVRGMLIRVAGGWRPVLAAINTSSGRRSISYRDADGEVQVTLCGQDRVFTVGTEE
jgi:hypothetical protein